ncbi:hypothetical protein PRVXT_002412 [Proteinivorax tanatarense]|uniref:ABC-2 family transporter protein n=1 Tax=Proteinivorax tanatarense TaxID=1260629 RepID=A0AAU7VJZ8_9FIRM
MKKLIGYEMKKVLKRPMVIGVLALVIIYNFLMIFYGTFPGEPTYGLKYSKQEVERIKEDRTEFAGYIDDDWIQNIKYQKESILYDPANQISDKEKEAKIDELVDRGFSREEAESNIFFFVKEEVLESRELQRLEEPEVSGNFYHRADKKGNETAEYYRETYQGQKGEALALKAEEMYGYLSNKHVVYYDYSWGWSRLHAMQTVLPYTIGVFLVVALSPIFSQEYWKKTDSLILTTKYGKNRIIAAKIIISFVIAVSAWVFIQLINFIMIAVLFGLEGSKSFLQNWVQNPSPYPFTYLSSYFFVLAMSFLGLIFFVSTILLISAKIKKTFTSLVVSGIVLLLPITFNWLLVDGIESADGIVSMVLLFSPSNVLIGVHHFKNFEAFYLFGNVVMLPIVIVVFSVISSILMLIYGYYSFKRYQVEN